MISGPRAPYRTERAQPKKVWLVHGSHTGGHASAARSLKEALDLNPDVETEIINLAQTSQSKLPSSTLAEAALKGGALSKNLRRWVFDQQFEGNPIVKWVTDRVMASEGRAQSEFLERVNLEKPDLIVSTMSASNSMLNSLKESGDLDVPLQSVVTDFSGHQVWAQENIAFYYVATDAVKEDLQRFGVPEEKVRVTGIPIQQAFNAKTRAPKEARQDLGLDPSKPTVLLLGGSLGYGNFEDTAKALDQIPGEFQMVAITGKNEKLAGQLTELSTTHPLTVKGYVDNMPQWIEAADLVISKPGGLTSSEILARGKAMLVQDVKEGLEGHMVGGLVATGGALAVENNDELRDKVAYLLGDNAAHEELTDRAKSVGRPNSANEVADFIIADLGM